MRIPAPTICRFLRLKLQWVVVRARTGPTISETNKTKHFDFATKCISDEDSLPFQDMINSFTKASYDLDSTPTTCHLVEFSQ